MHPRCRIILSAAWCLTLIASTAIAQSGDTERVGPVPPSMRSGDGMSPVDQAVGDLDPRAHSLRRVDPGIARYSERTHLYRLNRDASHLADELGMPAPLRVPHEAQYRYEAPGVRAWMRRPGYLVRGQNGGMATDQAPARDGEFRTMIPPDTVFDLVPDTAPQRAQSRQRVRQPRPHPHRINTRISTRLHTRMDPRDARHDARMQNRDNTQQRTRHQSTSDHRRDQSHFRLPVAPRPRHRHRPAEPTAPRDSETASPPAATQPR